MAETSGSSNDGVDAAEVNMARGLRDYTKAKHHSLVRRIEQLPDNTDERERTIHKENLVELTSECLEYHQVYAKRGGLSPEETAEWERELQKETEKVLHLEEEEASESLVIGTKGKRVISQSEKQEAKRQRIELEWKLQQARRKAEQELFQAQLEERRKLEDIKMRAQREEQEIRDELERSWRTIEDGGGSSNPKTSTPMGDHRRPPTTFSFGSFAAQPSLMSNTTWLESFVTKMRAQPYDGSPKEWPSFIAAYDGFVEESTLSDNQKVLILRDVLGADVKRRMSHLLQSPDTYPAALEELRRRYGDPYFLVKYHVQGLLSLPICKSGDHQALYQFSSQLHDTVATLQALKQAEKLSYGTTLEQLVCKLPTEVQSAWARHSFKMRPEHATIVDLDKWLDELTAAEEEMRNSQQAAGSLQLQKQLPTRGVSPENKAGRAREGRERQRTVTFATQVTDDRCRICNSQPGHGLNGCQGFMNMSPTQRAEEVNRLRNCFRCLGRGHYSAECKKETTCNIDGCKARHHHLLHNAERVNNRSRERESRPSVSTCAIARFSSSQRRTVLLQVLPILVYHTGGWEKTYALLDTASEATLIKADFARKLGMEEQKSDTVIGTIHGEGVNTDTTTTCFTIAAMDHSVTYWVENALTVPQMHLTKRVLNWPREKEKWNYLADLPLPMIDTSKITILVGMDIVEAHIATEVRRPPGDVTGPRAMRTPLGWSVAGRYSNAEAKEDQICGATSTIEPTLEAAMERFWTTESFGTKPYVKPLIPLDDQLALECFEKTGRFLGKRYELGLPWKIPRVVLPDNSKQVLKLFIKLESRLLRDQGKAARYAKSITEYMRLGHAKVVPQEIIDKESPGDRWYMQHLPVYNPAKPDKERIVFNLSLQCNGTSLNDVLLKGPDFYPSQNGVLLRFRRRRIAVSADIEKMFLQVQVIKEDQPYLSFWWREPGDKTPPRTYQMLVEVFGAVSSPSSCLYIIRKNVSDNPEYGDLEDKVKLNMFVDNYLDSFDSLEEAENTCRRMTELFSKGGFRLNQWTSSSREFLCRIPQSERNQPKLDLDWDKLPTERMLGNWFDAEEDTFNFKFKSLKEVKTMRQLMAAIASVYDPLGFIAAVVVTAKIIKQDAWKEKIGLDDELPQHILSRWQKWYSSLNHLNELHIPRCLEDKAEQKSNGREELHVFCDASEAAFGAVVYWRKEYLTKVHLSFVMAKTRVAPIKPLTIPKLELQAAVLGFRLSRTVLEELQLNCPVVFWTDSQTVLQWIGSTHYKLERFVTNRVAEILELSKPDQWRHVPGKLNPADECSRGIDAALLNPDHRFLKGPDFLVNDRTTWPSPQAIETVVIAATTEETISQDDRVKEAERRPILLLIERFSSFEKIQRMVARLKQCVRIWRMKRRGEPQPPMWLRSKDLKEALLVCLREVQEKEFREEVAAIRKGKSISATSFLKKLTPIMDDDGVLRIGGRLEHSNLPYEAKHPIILAPNLLAERIVADIHIRFNHSSAERTFYESRAKYWVLRGRKIAKRVTRNCVRCKKMFGKPSAPVMAPLPSQRLQPFQPAFACVGVDFFGPFLVAIGRRTEKRYGCMFTCMVTRGAHLEITAQMDVDSFMLAFRRFVGRRGAPHTVFSDNGTNLVAGQRELEEGRRRIENQLLASRMATMGISWRFSPPVAPHFGGSWERMIKTCKSALSVVLRDRSVKEEVLQTVFVEVESLINARPLTHLSVDPQDPSPLTPNHFLLNRPHPHIPPDVLDERAEVSRRRWLVAQSIVEQYWRRWLKEYTPHLIESAKWTKKGRNVQVDDIVLVVDANSPRGMWPIGRVVETKPGKDGVVRSAVVKVAIQGTNPVKFREYTRPVVKLCILLTDENVGFASKTGEVCGAQIGQEGASKGEDKIRARTEGGKE